MGRAMARDPRVFLLDEPLSNLDAKMRGQIRGEIARLHRENRKTTIYVTHDQVEAMTMGERVAVLRGGELQQVAPPRELYDRPANLFVAGFIGSPPMNLFPTRLCKTESGVFLKFGDRFLEIDPDRYRNLDRHLDRPIFAGLRPEAFFVTDRGDSALTVRVETVEVLGHESLVHFAAPVSGIDGESGESSIFVARIPAGRDLSIGSDVTLGIKPDAFYWFTAGGDTIF
jgi:ABC-type sugar transport system ATPase subunit